MAHWSFILIFVCFDVHVAAVDVLSESSKSSVRRLGEYRIHEDSADLKDDYLVAHPGVDGNTLLSPPAPTKSPSCATNPPVAIAGQDDNGSPIPTLVPTSLLQLPGNDSSTTISPSISPELIQDNAKPTLDDLSEATQEMAATNSPTEWTDFADGHNREEIIAHKCNGMRPAERSTEIANLIIDLSGLDNILNEDSPHLQALDWLDVMDGLLVCPILEDSPEAGFSNQLVLQRFTLALFYFSMAGNSWTFCSADGESSPCESAAIRWLSDSSECDWYGITCDEMGVVTNLDLTNNNLDGVLPVELFSLSSMKGLGLGHNGGIHGSIPADISKWNHLVYLDLDANSLEGPFPNVYDIATLQAIDVNNNRLSGSISAAISQLTQLVILQIENNRFGGTLPLEDIGSHLGNLVLFSSQGNDWDTDPDWEILCEWVPDHRAVTGAGYLQFLLADCDNDSTLSVQRPTCSCCSLCF